MGVPPRRILLVEDQAAIRTLATMALTAAGFEVFATATATEAIADFKGIDPDVLVADIDLGERPNGVELATILRAQAPYLSIVFLTNYPAALAFERTITPPQGYAYLQKDMLESGDRLLEVIESSLQDTTAPRRETSEGDDALADLTKAQLIVLRMTAAGLTNHQIAHSRGTSVRAVERQLNRIFATLGLDDSAGNCRVVAANLYTRRFGYVAPGEFAAGEFGA